MNVCLYQSFVTPYFLKFLHVAPRHLMSFFPLLLHPKRSPCTWLRTAAVQFSNQPKGFPAPRWQCQQAKGLKKLSVPNVTTWSRAEHFKARENWEPLHISGKLISIFFFCTGSERKDMAKVSSHLYQQNLNQE